MQPNKEFRPNNQTSHLVSALLLSFPLLFCPPLSFLPLSFPPLSHPFFQGAFLPVNTQYWFIVNLIYFVVSASCILWIQKMCYMLLQQIQAAVSALHQCQAASEAFTDLSHLPRFTLKQLICIQFNKHRT